MAEQMKIRVTKIENYIAGKNLGRGTFGDVKLATHTISGERVAMKVLEKEKIHTRDDFNRVVSEIKVLRLLKHPHIVKLLEVIETKSHIYIVEEYISHGELFNYIVKKKRLEEDEARKFFQEIISAVKYAHSRQVVHSDIKLENILLTNEDDIKIIDFGLSSILKSSGDSMSSACGSPSYISPEMLTSKEFDGFATDVWACGVILYAMLCGYLPFDDEHVDALYKKIIRGKFIVPDFVSLEAKDLLEKILVTDPKKRLTIEQIIQHEFFTKNLNQDLIKENLIESQNLDFRVVYSIIQAIDNWSAFSIIKALNMGKRNPMTATYILMNERRVKQEGYKWDFEEQKKYAKALNFDLHENGTIDVIEEEEVETNEQDSLVRDDSIIGHNDAMSESESLSCVLNDI